MVHHHNTDLFIHHAYQCICNHRYKHSVRKTSVCQSKGQACSAHNSSAQQHTATSESAVLRRFFLPFPPLRGASASSADTSPGVSAGLGSSSLCDTAGVTSSGVDFPPLLVSFTAPFAFDDFVAFSAPAHVSSPMQLPTSSDTSLDLACRRIDCHTCVRMTTNASIDFMHQERTIKRVTRRSLQRSLRNSLLPSQTPREVTVPHRYGPVRRPHPRMEHVQAAARLPHVRLLLLRVQQPPPQACPRASLGTSGPRALRCGP